MYNIKVNVLAFLHSTTFNKLGHWMIVISSSYKNNIFSELIMSNMILTNIHFTFLCQQEETYVWFSCHFILTPALCGQCFNLPFCYKVRRHNDSLTSCIIPYHRNTIHQGDEKA